MKRTAWSDLLLVPFVLVMGLLIYGLLEGMAQSLGYIPSLDLNGWTFEYYREVLQQESFIRSLLFSLQVAFVSASLSIMLALILMYPLIQYRKEGETVFSLSYIPIIVPHMVVALFVLLILGQKGLLARLFFASGIEAAPRIMQGLVHDRWGIGIALAYLWKEVPFVIFYSYRTLHQHHRKYADVAQVLGASPLQSFMQVTLPLSRQTLLSAFIILFTFAFASYELPHLLGPTLPQTLPEAAYTAFIHPDMTHRPYAMVHNGVMLGVSLLALAVFLWLRRDKDEV